MTPKQFGFRPKHSTATALTYFTDNILDNPDKGSIAGAVFLDLSKAFDTVSHDRLTQKLGTIADFSQPTINWFSSYLSNRFQVTSIGLEQSSTQPVHVGVPKDVYWVHYCFSFMRMKFPPLLKTVTFPCMQMISSYFSQLKPRLNWNRS